MEINMRQVKYAGIQMQCCNSVEENIKTADRLVHTAAGNGANIILLPELFERPYFCQERNYDYYSYATTVEDNPAIQHFKKVAAKLGVVLPIRFYERDVNVFYNSIAIIDADGTVLGIYRKTHIPDDHYYQEKFYFTPGNTGFKVWNTRYAKIGVGICWDQWFPEAARCMAVQGAEILLYPTAIGSEPILEVDSMPHWRRCMQGHAAANIMPVIASNRIGTETDETSMTFYGSSFITDHTGQILQGADRESQTVLVQSFDLDEIEEYRRSWGVWRDRRPEMYGILTTHGR